MPSVQPCHDRLIRYLMVTHIPFACDGATVELDALWLRDLEGLRDSIGRLTVAAPRITIAELHGWGPGGIAPAPPDNGIKFIGFPSIRSRRDLPKWVGIRRMLREAVAQADLVHTSNYFPPYLGLAYAHDLALRTGKKTLFVVAEDFFDMLAWEWCRLADGRLQRWRRERSLRVIDRRARTSAASASLTLLHTPAAVLRFRLVARNSIAIRFSTHELGDVIDESELEAKRQAILRGKRFMVVAAGRHRELKGFDFLIMAAAILKQRRVDIEVRLHGEGPASNDLDQLAKKLGVNDRVFLHGAFFLLDRPFIGRSPAVICSRCLIGPLTSVAHFTTPWLEALRWSPFGPTPVSAPSAKVSTDGSVRLTTPKASPPSWSGLTDAVR